MSLLDDVSIVVTPNGYKAGELYAVIPVPTYGAELVVCEDFACADPDAVWSRGTGWTISGGIASQSSGNGQLSQSGILTANKLYSVSVVIDSINAGGELNIVLGSQATTLTFTESGTKTGVAEANEILYILGNATFTGSISSVSVKEYTSADMDVTRATAATRVDENGLVNYAEVLGGEEVTNGDYTEAGVGNVISQSGGVLVNDSNRLKMTSDTSSGYSRGVWATGGSAGDTFVIEADIISTSGSVRFYDQSNNATYTDVVAGSNYKKYIVLGSSSNNLGFGGNNDTSFELILDNVSVKQVTRDNVPRIDYTGGGCPHILAEPQRTNLFPYSEDFANSDWTKNAGTTITANYAISPDGSLNASRYLGTGASGIGDKFTLNAVSNTLSFFVKSNTGQNQFCRITGESSNQSSDLLVTTEWSRITYTFTASGLSDKTNGIFRDSNNNDIDILIWGAQLEEGSYPTSYIPTSGQSGGVTRNQDIFTRDGIGSLINSTEGVFFAEMAALSNSGNYRLITLSDGTTSNRVFIGFRLDTGYIYYFVIVGGSTVASHITSTTSLDFSKIAVKWKANDFALWINGSEISTQTSGNSFSANTLNTLQMNEGDGAGFEFHGKVKQLQVYDTALTDNQLIQLTGEAGTHFFESYTEMAEALTYTIQ